MSRPVRVSAVMLLSVSLLFGAVGLSAQSEPEDLIKYRQNLMRAQAGHLGAMAQIINGGVALGSQLPVHARNLHTLTGFLVNVFPEDSDFGETRAKEEIWEDFDAFNDAARRAHTAAGQLATVAEFGSQEELQAKLGAVVDGCKGCHKKYRARKP